jgi:hypothetical protein
MRCINCSKDVVSAGTKPKKYCSDACRKAYKRTFSKRTGQTDSPFLETDTGLDIVKPPDICDTGLDNASEDGPGSTNSLAPIAEHPLISDLTRRQLYDAIRAYPNDQWINTPEHNELMSRLNSWTVERLELEGYWIPAWRRAG